MRFLRAGKVELHAEVNASAATFNVGKKLSDKQRDLERASGFALYRAAAGTASAFESCCIDWAHCL